MTRSSTRRLAAALALTVASVTLTACGGGGDSDGAGNPGGEQVTLVTHDSFNVSPEVLERFTEETGYRVQILRAGDAGVMVNQAVLSKNNPQGDVLFGIDNTLLSRALDEGVFAPYEAAGLEAIPETYQLDAGEHRVTPVDTGDICVNYDRAYFAEHDLAPPQTLDDLIDPAYRDLLVVQNAATSSPGLGFLLSTGRLGGVLAGAARQRCRGGRRLGAGVQRALLRRRRGRGRPAAGGLLRVQPAGRGDLRGG